ncbi:MAG: hypothetical protein AAF351_04560 [Pseudomonadota bacterium]
MSNEGDHGHENEEKDEEMICALTADERDALIRGLNEMPETMPPRAVWNRIREQAEAEGLIGTSTARPFASRTNWLVGVGIAAAVVLAVLLIPRMQQDLPAGNATTPQMADQVEHRPQVTPLQALMVESRQLENDLRALPEMPKVIRAGTAATISEVEDSIAAIDFQLNDASFQMSAEERELFWRERVRLMKILVRLRYAQAQRAAF